MSAVRFERTSPTLEIGFLPLETRPNVLAGNCTRILGLEAPRDICYTTRTMHPDGNAPSFSRRKREILLLNYGCAFYFFPHFNPRLAFGFLSFDDLPFSALDDDFCWFAGSSAAAFTDRISNTPPWTIPHTVHLDCPVLISLATRLPPPYILSWASCLHVHFTIFVVILWECGRGRN